MQRKYIIFFCYLLMRNDCYGCQTRGNNPLCSLIRNTHKISKGNFRKLTRNILQSDAYEIKTLTKIIQDRVHVNEQPHDIGISTSPIPQTNVFQDKFHDEFGSPEYTISASPLPQNNNFKREITRSKAIHYDIDAYLKDDKFSDSSTPQISNFKRDIEEQVTSRNIIQHDKGRYTNDAEGIKFSEHQDDRSVRIRREEVKDSSIYFDLDKVPKAEKGIKILEQEPGETQCNYNQCVEICNTIYFAIPIHLAQCYNNTCFCFPKKDLYPPVIKNFMKTHKLFGIQQTYE